MTVKELKDLIHDLPDDMPVLYQGDDREETTISSARPEVTQVTSQFWNVDGSLCSCDRTDNLRSWGRSLENDENWTRITKESLIF